MEIDTPGDESAERAALERELEVMRALDAVRSAGPWGEAMVGLYERAREMQDLVRPIITVEQPPAVVVPAAEVRVDAPVIPDYSVVLATLVAKIDDMVAAIVAVAPPVVNVTVPEQPAPVVNVTVAEPGGRRVTFKRDRDGRISSAVVTDG